MAQAKKRTKSIKGLYYVFNKTIPGEMTGERVKPQELCALFDFIKKKKLIERYIGEPESMLIAFNGDKLNGIKIPADDEIFKYGVFLKKREAQFPYEGKDNEDGDSIEVTQIELNEESYMFEMTYFMLDKRSGILLYLDSKNVGKINSFVNYLQGYLSTPDLKKYDLLIGNKLADKITEAPIPTPDIQKRLENFRRISAFTFKLGGIASQSLYVGRYTSSDKMISNAAKEVVADTEMLEGFSLEFRIVPKKRKSLAKEKIMTIFKRFENDLRQDESKAKFRIEGKSGIREDFDILDFLEDDFMINSELNYTGRYAPIDEIFNIMEGNFKGRRKELLKVLGLREQEL